jgi:uncharacterized membrane protein YfcA
VSVVALVVVTLLAASAACVQGSAGFGMALLAAPLLTLVDRSFAPAPLVLAVLPLSVLVAQRDWAHLDRNGLAWAIGGRLPGVVLGAIAAAALSEHTLALVLGLGVLVAVGLSMVTARLRPSPSALVSAGFASGFMSTTTSIGGPPMALVYQRSEGPAFRSTLAIYFAAGAVMSLAGLAIAGRVGAHELRLGLLLWPGVILGFLLSKPLTRYLDDGRTRPLVLTFSALAALLLIAEEVL